MLHLPGPAPYLGCPRRFRNRRCHRHKALVAEPSEHDPSISIDCTGGVYQYQNGILIADFDSNPIMVVIDVRRSFESPLDPSRIRKILPEPLPSDIITDCRYLFCVHQIPHIRRRVDSPGKLLKCALK